ncbi:MAG: response regulator [Caldilineaceae bacterium]
MPIPLRVLILEDRPDDAELMLYELRKVDYVPDWQRVETEQTYLTALAQQPEIILADYTMPQFNALRALQLLQERNFDIPFIVVTNTLSDEVAVQCIKQGASDYLLKDRMARLGSAVAHALEQHRNRQKRQQAEEALRYNEMFNRTVLNSVGDHIAVLDAQGVIIQVNEAWKRFAQENGDPTLEHTGVGINYLDVCRRVQGEDEAMAQAAVAGIEAVMAGRLPLFSTLEYACHSHHEKRWFLLKVTPLPGQIGGVVIAHPDITERKLAEEQLRQQDRLSVVGQLAAGIAHDFNNSLQAITLYSQILLNVPTLNAHAQEHLQVIHRQAMRAGSLIAQIMDFSRQSVMERHPLEVKTYLSSLVSLLKRTLQENIQIKLNCSQRDLYIDADLTRLEQVFMNLAVNARDAMPDGGWLRLDVETFHLTEPNPAPPLREMPIGHWVCISMSDTGMGIPQQNLHHLFEPFFTTKAPGKGTGLGLAQVYGIVKQHDGFIDVESEVGKGTTFKLYFPLLNSAERQGALLLPTQLIVGNRETILVVEDDSAIRAAVSNALRTLEYEVLIAKSGKEALHLFEQESDTIALVLSDLVMPEIDGTKLYQHLSQKRPDIKVVIMSGYALPERLKSLYQSGKIGYLAKPFDLQQVAEVVFKALNSSQ